MNDIFYYVSACAGSGKTTTAMQAMAKGIKFGNKFVVAQPTKRLVDSTVNSQRNKITLAGAKIAVITSDHFPGTTHGAFIKAINDADVDVIFTTHSTVMSCWNIANKGNWDLIIDEIPNVDIPFHSNLSLTWDHWTRHFVTKDSDDADAVDVFPKPGSEQTIQNWAWNELGDDVIKVTQTFWDILINPNYRLSMTKADWQTAGYEGKAELNAHGTLLPAILKGWHKVTIMGANFENSLLKIVWSEIGIDFQPDNSIRVKNATHSTTTGARARIHYFTERNWSKYLRNEITFPVIADKLAEHIDGPHIWAANNDVQDWQWKAKDGERLAPISHGLNSYVDFDKAIYIAALNDTPAHSKWLQNRYGLAPDDLGKAKAFEAAYQMVMRTNLRDPAGTKNVDIYVADRRTADYLCDLLPGSKQNFIDLGLKGLGDSKRDLARTQPKQSQAERNKASLERKATYKAGVEELKGMLMEFQNVLQTSEIKPMVSFEESIHSTEITTQTFDSFDAVKAMLEQMYQVSYKSKDENLLITGATFSKTDESETAKGLDAFVFTQILQLDFDDSELSPELASLLFKDIKHLSYNSYNNGRDGLYRYRMFFPLALPVTVEVYQMLWDTLAQRVIDRGYEVDKKRKGLQSGLDVSKRTPVAWMYGPCQAAKKENSFWLPNWGAYIMDPIAFINRSAAETPEYVEVAPVDNRSEAVKNLMLAVNQGNTQKTDAQLADAEQRKKVSAYERSLAKWQATPSGEGDSAFFAFGSSLKRAGYSLIEIESLLKQHYSDSGSNSAHRKAQIKSIIASLKRGK